MAQFDFKDCPERYSIETLFFGLEHLNSVVSHY